MLTLKELADELGGSLHGVSDSAASQISIEGISAVDRAKSSDVTFLIKPEYMKFASSTAAAAVIAGKPLDDCPRPQIIHKNPYWAFAKTAQKFSPKRHENQTVSELAYVSKTAKLGKGVTVYPFAFISDGCDVGDYSVIYPGAFLGVNTKIGSHVVIRASVTIEDHTVIGHRVLIHGNTVIGADGFGFAPGETDIAKIPQVGIVRIGDDVEIGGGSTIDRAAMGETYIRSGCKLDSSVHVAHNADIGDHTMMCGGAFVAGSAKIGKWNILAGSSNVNNHVVLGDRVVIGAMAGVTKSLNEPGEYMGFPAVPAAEWRRQIASIRRLEALTERVAKLEEALANYDKKL
jgi:UDP-3-O-[3-hydroxymyristoyl] glucosamine N-acyltransferase